MSTVGGATRPVPLVDLPWQHRQIAEELLPELTSAMAAGSFVGGAPVTAFEEAFASVTGRAHCVGVANGTDAIELALRAAGLPPGAGVVLPANTFFATAEAVVRAGARPVLVDCDVYGLIDVDAVADCLGSPWVRAVVPVHLYGQMADMEAITPIAADCSAAVIEDAAQAQGATRYGRGIGSWGAAAATSFYPGKNLGAYGDAGAVVTDDAALAAQVRRLGNHGSESKYRHVAVGTNSRLDALQALVLSAKLRHLAEWDERRRSAAALYEQLLEPLRDEGAVSLPLVAPGNVHVWHLYVIQVARRDRVLDELHRSGIGAGVHYPLPLHLQPALGGLGYRQGEFPVAEARAAAALSLPLYPGITEDDQARVVAALTSALAG